VPVKTRKLHKKNYILNHSTWDKLGQQDPNTFSRIEAQTQSKFGVTTLGYHYWQVIGGMVYGKF
jgi:hypothetical protein